MAVKMSVKMDVAKGLRRMTRDPNGLVGRGMNRAQRIVEERAKQNVNRMGRVDTGQMRDTIHGTGVTSTSTGLTFTVVAPVRYARYQEFGTRWITPAPFLGDALKSLRPRDFV